MKKVLNEKQAQELGNLANAGYIKAKELIQAAEELESGNQEEALRLTLAYLCANFVDKKMPY